MQVEAIDELKEASTREVELEEEKVLATMKKIRLRSMCKLLSELHFRRSFSMIGATAQFKQSKVSLLEKMPLPRRKKWWEKLSEHQHDHFYNDAEDLLETVPQTFLPCYQVIIDHKLMDRILIIQRYVKKRGLERWLVDQNPENRDWRNKFLVNVHNVDMLGDSAGKAGSEPNCTIF